MTQARATASPAMAHSRLKSSARVCPVASAAVIGEAVTAVVLAQAAQEKFGGDSLREMADNLARYNAHLRSY